MNITITLLDGTVLNFHGVDEYTADGEAVSFGGKKDGSDKRRHYRFNWAAIRCVETD